MRYTAAVTGEEALKRTCSCTMGNGVNESNEPANSSSSSSSSHGSIDYCKQGIYLDLLNSKILPTYHGVMQGHVVCDTTQQQSHHPS